MRAWDPLSRNPYRLLGIPREQKPPQSRSAAVVLACEGLEHVDLTEELLQDCLQRLASDQLGFYRASWFDSTRPLDQLAWLDICERRLADAWRRWSSENHLLSQHNLAVLAQLLWINEPGNQSLWRDCANRWRDLASLTQERGYYQVLEQFTIWQKAHAFELMARGDAAQLRECWRVTALLSSPEEVQAEQQDLLGAELERWQLEMSALRQAILDGVAPDRVTQRFEQAMLPLAQLLQTATSDNLPLAGELRGDLAKFYRLLARSWHDLPEDRAKDYAEAWLEKAVELAPPDLRGEWRAELDHWRVSRYPGEVRPVAVTLVTSAEVEAPRRRLGGILIFLALIGLLWAGSQRRDPMAGMTRIAAQKRADEISQELGDLAQRLSKMPAQIEKAQGPEKQRLLDKQETDRQRRSALVGELSRLRAWLDSH